MTRFSRQRSRSDFGSGPGAMVFRSKPVRLTCSLFILFGTSLVLNIFSVSEQPNLLFVEESTEVASLESMESRGETEPGEISIQQYIQISKDKNHDKERVLLLLKNNAGVQEISENTYQQLPTWSQITELYGSKPRILGLEQCESYQSYINVIQGDQKGLAVAGMFNSGTNLLSVLLASNCNLQFTKTNRTKRYLGIYPKTPWGKHNPPNISVIENDPRQILPVVTIRDPYRWMQSMCKAPYAADWPLNRNSKPNDIAEDKHCPALVPTDRDRELLQRKNIDAVLVNETRHYFPVRVTYSRQQIVKHYSLVHLWNDWYQEYIGLLQNQKVPRLMIRMEDLIFFPDQVVSKVCSCAGGQLIAYNNNGNIKMTMSSAKDGMPGNSRQTSYLEAIIRYGSQHSRYSGMTREDTEYARKYLNKEMMDTFHYLLS